METVGKWNETQITVTETNNTPANKHFCVAQYQKAALKLELEYTVLPGIQEITGPGSTKPP